MPVHLPVGKSKQLNLYPKDFMISGALIILLAIGGFAASRHFGGKKSSNSAEISNTKTQSSSYASTGQSYQRTSPVKPENTQTPHTPTTSASTSSTAEPDNSAKCESIAAKQKSEVKSLDSQIALELEIMKTIIGNSSLDSKILSYGGSLNAILTQSQINQTFDQANEKANQLIDQLGSVNDSARNQMLALLNSNSSSCSSILHSQLGG